MNSPLRPAPGIAVLTNVKDAGGIFMVGTVDRIGAGHWVHGAWIDPPAETDQVCVFTNGDVIALNKREWWLVRFEDVLGTLPVGSGEAG